MEKVLAKYGYKKGASAEAHVHIYHHNDGHMLEHNTRTDGWYHMPDNGDKKSKRGIGKNRLDAHLAEFHGSQHKETNMVDFVPSTPRQTQLVDEIKLFVQRQQEQAKTVQFQEREQEYFVTNLKTLVSRLEEECKGKKLAVDYETGVVQFAEEPSEGGDRLANHHKVLTSHGYTKIGSHAYQHPRGDHVILHPGGKHGARFMWVKHDEEGGGTSYDSGTTHDQLQRRLTQAHGS